MFQNVVIISKSFRDKAAAGKILQVLIMMFLPSLSTGYSISSKIYFWSFWSFILFSIFRYKTEKVWDKTERLDIMFGSTGSKVEEVDRQIKEERNNSLDDDDFDSDDEESGPSISVQVNTESDIHHISEEERSTHFIAIKISYPEIIENVSKVQKQIIGKEEILQDCCMKKGLLHITFAMVRIEGKAGVEEAKKLMRDLKPELSNILLTNLRPQLGLKTYKALVKELSTLMLHQLMRKHF
jgi:hypothetical protein